jgi:hypothetical protein
MGQIFVASAERSRYLMNPCISTLAASIKHWPTITCWPGALTVEVCDTIIMFLAAFIRCGDCNGDCLIILVYSSTRVWGWYAKLSRGQGSLNRGSTLVALP